MLGQIANNTIDIGFGGRDQKQFVFHSRGKLYLARTGGLLHRAMFGPPIVIGLGFRWARSVIRTS
jgi:hypothetical protein